MAYCVLLVTLAAWAVVGDPELADANGVSQGFELHATDPFEGPSHDVEEGGACSVGPPPLLTP